MKIDLLLPFPSHVEAFKKNRLRFIPETSGCYVLTSFEKVVLYIGLSKNIRRRMNEHLDSQDKTSLTQNGKAMYFYWLENSEINKIERTWLNIHIQNEGELPILNKAYSPVST